MKKQITKFSDADPEVIAKLVEKAKVVKIKIKNFKLLLIFIFQEYREATNKWTDNIFAIQSWCKNKFDISEGCLNKQFNIPDDLDYKE